MPEEVYPEYVRRFIAETAQVLDSRPRIEPLPPEVIEGLRTLQPYTDAVRAAIEHLAVTNSLAGIQARQQDTFARIAESFAATQRLPVPTPRELSEAEAALRARVQPETPEQAEAVANAVSEVTARPERKKAVDAVAKALKHSDVVARPLLPALLYWWLCHETGLPLTGHLKPDQYGLYLAVIGIVISVIVAIYPSQ
jgi:hypothetical protein